MMAKDWDDAQRMRPFIEWHEDFGDVLWWNLPIEEPPYCGTPLDNGWPRWDWDETQGITERNTPPYQYWTPIVVPAHD